MFCDDIVVFLIHGGCCIFLILLAMFLPAVVTVSYPLVQERTNKEAALDLFERLNSGIRYSVCACCGLVYDQADCDDIMVSHGVCKHCANLLYNPTNKEV